MKAVRQKETDGFLKYGFFIHFVPDTGDTPMVNIHTHCLPQSFDHPDIQIVFPLPTDIFYPVLHGMVDQIREGQRFEDGKFYYKVITNFPVKCIASTECGRPVIRVLFPDPNGKFPGENGVNELYRKQTDLLE